jgi:hypothetical protein
MRAIIAQNIVLGHASRLDLLNAKTSTAVAIRTTTAAKPIAFPKAWLNVQVEIIV